MLTDFALRAPGWEVCVWTHSFAHGSGFRDEREHAATASAGRPQLGAGIQDTRHIPPWCKIPGVSLELGG